MSPKPIKLCPGPAARINARLSNRYEFHLFAHIPGEPLYLAGIPSYSFIKKDFPSENLFL
jgi:hypothetical protein